MCILHRKEFFAWAYMSMEIFLCALFVLGFFCARIFPVTRVRPCARALYDHVHSYVGMMRTQTYAHTACRCCLCMICFNSLPRNCSCVRVCVCVSVYVSVFLLMYTFGRLCMHAFSCMHIHPSLSLSMFYECT